MKKIFPFVVIAMLEGIAIATTGSALSERHTITTSKFITLFLIGFVCVGVQLLIWSKNQSKITIKPSRLSFLNNHPVIGFLASSIIGIVIGSLLMVGLAQ